MITNPTSRFLAVAGLTLLISAGCTTPKKEERQKPMTIGSYELPMYEPPSDAELENMKANYFGASGAAFSPDGRRVAVGTREMIWVADTVSLKTTARLDHQHAAWFGNSKSLVFIDNQRMLVGAEGAILLWDLKEGLVTHRLPLQGRDYSPRAIAWSPATAMLAFSSGASGTPVKIVSFGPDGFGPVREFPGFEGVPADLQFSQDGRFLAAAGDGEGVSIREVETAEFAGILPTNGFVSNLELFGESQLLVSGRNIMFWTFVDDDETLDFENASLQGQIAGQVMVRTAGTVALGTLALVAVAVSPILQLFTLQTAIPAAAELAGASYNVANDPVITVPRSWCGRSTAISHDGRWLADVYPGITSEIIRVYDLESDQESRGLNPKGKVSCVVKFSPDGKQLLITSNKVARLYDTESWRYHDLKLDRR